MSTPLLRRQPAALLALLLLAALLEVRPPPVRAANATVGGAPASCTEAQMRSRR